MAPYRASNNRRPPVWKLNTFDRALFNLPGRSNDPNDDPTVITSNLLSHSNNQQQQQEHHQKTKNGFDKFRAPRIAVLLFTTFFLFASSNLISQSLRGDVQNTVGIESKDRNENDSDSDSENDDDTIQNSSKSLNQVVDDVSKPNLDSNNNPMRLPPELANLADINIPLGEKDEVAILWHVPRSGGSTIKEIASFCYDLTLASEVGASIDPNKDTMTNLTTLVEANSGAKFLNVDTTSPEGIERARSFNIAAYNGLDLIATPYIFLASNALFNAVNRGRLIVFFRHPVERAVSMYYYLKEKAGIRGAQIGESLDLYAKSNMVENNWMTRFLTNKMGGELTPDDEATAKEVLRTKALVGLLSKKTESMRRFKTYFGWNKNDSKQKLGDCEDKLLHWGWSGKNKHKTLKEGTDTWNFLKEQNTFDIRLYEYAVELFEAQGVTIFQNNEVRE